MTMMMMLAGSSSRTLKGVAQELDERMIDQELKEITIEKF